MLLKVRLAKNSVYCNCNLFFGKIKGDLRLSRKEKTG